MRKSFARTIAFVISFIYFTPFASAQLMLSYEFTGSSLAPTFVDSSLTTATPFAYTGPVGTFFPNDSTNPGVTVVPPSCDPQFAAGGWPVDATGTAYFSFTAGATTGMTVDELSFWAMAANPNGNDLDYRIDMSIGGAPFQNIGTGNIPPSNLNTQYLFQNHPISLNNETLDVRFRIYGINYTPLSSFRIDDVRLTANGHPPGTPCVPEPSSFLFLSLLVTTCFGWRKFRGTKCG